MASETQKKTPPASAPTDSDRMRLLTENVSAGIFEIDPSGQILAMNPLGLALFGFEREHDALRQPYTRLFKDSERERAKNFFAKALGGENLRFETKRDTPAGQAALLCRFTPLKNADQSVSRVMGIIQDISDLKKTEDMLFNAQKKYRSVIDNIPDILIEIDPDGTLLFLNRILPRYSLDRLIGANILDLIDADQRHLFQNAFKTAQTTGQSCEYEISALQPDGSRVWWNSKITPMLENGVITRYILLNQDITEKKKAIQEKESIMEQLFQAQKLESLGKLAGGVAHEFNNLLAIIQLHCAMLAEQLKGRRELTDEVKVITKSSERAEELTRQLLGFARKGKYGSKPIEVGPIIKEATGLLKTSFPQKGKISIRLHLADKLPLIFASESQVLQCLMNLGLNAIDAMPNGGTIDISSFVDKSSVCISMQDTGEGIAAENLQRIFDPFFTTKDIGKGTGLGLSMIYGIMENHDGQVKVTSEPGKGATFTLSFPALLGDNTHEKAKNPHRRR